MPATRTSSSPPHRAARARAWLADWKRFGTLKAVRGGRLVAFEDQALSRLGPSVVDATEELCRAIARVNRGSY